MKSGVSGLQRHLVDADAKRRETAGQSQAPGASGFDRKVCRGTVLVRASSRRVPRRRWCAPRSPSVNSPLLGLGVRWLLASRTGASERSGGTRVSPRDVYTTRRPRATGGRVSEGFRRTREVRGAFARTDGRSGVRRRGTPAQPSPALVARARADTKMAGRVGLDATSGGSGSRRRRC